MKLLVTGGAGFIGSHYVRTLLSGGYPGFDQASVTVFDKFCYAGNLDNLRPVARHPGLRVVRGDICDSRALAQVVAGHDYVVNFAGQTHVDRSISEASDFVVTNVNGVQAIAQACLDARVRALVHVSTDEVYGSVAAGSVAEDAPIDPSSPYAASKAGGELIALAYAKTHGLDVRITRGCNTYGPYQYPEKVIPLFVTNLLDGRPVPLYGDGKHVRSWLHVDDHCRGIQAVLCEGRPAGIYHIAGDIELTNIELTRMVLDRCGVGWGMVTHVADRKAHDRRYSIDDSKLRALGYSPRTQFGSGLTATVEWYRQHRQWWDPLKNPPDASQAAATAMAGQAVTTSTAATAEPSAL
jgi:dTDP-glucose 4,6-dehydratase